MLLKLWIARVDPGNQIFRIMFAHLLAGMADEAEIRGCTLPEFGLNDPATPDPDALSMGGRGHRFDPAELIARCRAGGHPGIVVDAYVQRLEYFVAHHQRFARLFASDVPGTPLGDDEILVHIRLGDITHGAHPLYFPLPIAHYRRLFARTGLRPVFIGQIADDFYSEALRRAFPEATFLVGRSWIEDFQTIRRARNVALSISTFAWTAAWLSEVPGKRIHMPIAGLFHPVQNPPVDLVPVKDRRYVFHAFKPMTYRGTPEQKAMLIA